MVASWRVNSAMSLGLIFFARTHAALLDFGGENPLATQSRLHLVFSDRADFATNDLSVAVLALPLEDKILDIFG
jgi:hypothetical protein